MSFPRYPKYKPSGVEWLGEVPEHWEVARLRTVATLNPSKSEADALDRDAPVSFLPMECITTDGKLQSVENRKTSEVWEGYTYFRRNDVVMAKITPCFENGKGALMRGLKNQAGFGTTELIVIRPDRSKLSPEFLERLVRSSNFRQLGEAAMYGAGGQKRVPDDFVRDFRAAVPPLPEQRAIAAFLDRETAKIDALVAEQERLIELLAEKRQAVISHAVTKGLDPAAPMKPSGVEWLGDVPAQWCLAPVGSRYAVQLGRMLDSAKQTGKHLRPYLRVFDVQWGKINIVDLPTMDFDEDAREKYRLRSGDLLVNEGGSYPGRAAIWQDEITECYFQKALHRLRPWRPESDSTEHMYFAMRWAAEFGVFSAGGMESTIEHLPAERLRRYRFVFPSIHEQRSISAFLKRETARIDALVAQAEKAVTLLRERRSALISAAVTGQIDVRNAVPESAA